MMTESLKFHSVMERLLGKALGGDKVPFRLNLFRLKVMSLQHYSYFHEFSSFYGKAFWYNLVTLRS